MGQISIKFVRHNALPRTFHTARRPTSATVETCRFPINEPAIPQFSVYRRTSLVVFTMHAGVNVTLQRCRYICRIRARRIATEGKASPHAEVNSCLLQFRVYVGRLISDPVPAGPCLVQRELTWSSRALPTLFSYPCRAIPDAEELNRERRGCGLIALNEKNLFFLFFFPFILLIFLFTWTKLRFFSRANIYVWS